MSLDFINPVIILDDLIQRLYYIRSSDRSNSPFEENTQVRNKIEHWIAYAGSSYGEENISDPITTELIQIRTMEFQSYVKVLDIQRDHRNALSLHQSIMWLLADYTPQIDKYQEQIRSSLKLVSDTLLSPRGEENTFRYSATYRIETITGKAKGTLSDFQANEISFNLWRSQAEDLGNIETSTQDAIIKIKGE